MINKEIALVAKSFEHVIARNADKTPVRCRANGRCRTWVTRPHDFELPVKYGLKECFYLTPENAHLWVPVDSYNLDHVKLKPVNPEETGVFAVLPTEAGVKISRFFEYIRTSKKPNLSNEGVTLRRIESGEELTMRKPYEFPKF